jgi:formate--tetrahydrofolate ligase
MHGGLPKAALSNENLDALEKGTENLEQHLENLAKFGVPAVVAINRFPSDTEAELHLLEEKCASRGVDVILSEVFTKGGDGGIELAQKVVEICDAKKSKYEPLYDVDKSIAEKIRTIATEIYRADGVEFTSDAQKQIADIERLELDGMPICMAKTQYSFSDNANLLGAPAGFKITVREVRISAGAGFIVAITGEIMTMPGLPKVPAANSMDITEDGEIIGLS